MRVHLLVLHLFARLAFSGLLRRPKYWLATEWEDLLAIVESAEDGTWKALPTSFAQVTFQMLVDRLLSPSGGNGFAVNIGAQDGQNHDPIYPLFERGYAGLAIEAEPRWHDALTQNLAQVNSSQQVFIAMERVSPVNLLSLLGKFRVPSRFDALKIDIDSIDLTILRTILHSGYSPQIVMIEVNHDIPPPFQFELEYDPECECKVGRGAYGASVDAVFREASLRGYSLVAMEFYNLAAECPFCEHNLWFVRNELLGRGRESPLVSWRGMVRMFWAQLAGFDCLHVGKGLGSRKPMCPRHQLRELVAELGGWNSSWSLARMSFQAAQHPILSMAAASVWRSKLEYPYACSQACRFSVAVTRLDEDIGAVSQGPENSVARESQRLKASEARPAQHATKRPCRTCGTSPVAPKDPESSQQIFFGRNHLELCKLRSAPKSRFLERAPPA